MEDVSAFLCLFQDHLMPYVNDLRTSGLVHVYHIMCSNLPVHPGFAPELVQLHQRLQQNMWSSQKCNLIKAVCDIWGDKCHVPALSCYGVATTRFQESLPTAASPFTSVWCSGGALPQLVNLRPFLCASTRVMDRDTEVDQCERLEQKGLCHCQ